MPEQSAEVHDVAGSDFFPLDKDYWVNGANVAAVEFRDGDALITFTGGRELIVTGSRLDALRRYLPAFLAQ